MPLCYENSKLILVIVRPQITSTNDVIPGHGAKQHEQSWKDSIHFNTNFLAMKPPQRANLTAEECLSWRRNAKRFIRHYLPASVQDAIKHEIDRYDMRVQPSKSRCWAKAKQVTSQEYPITFIQFETIRCTEMGYLHPGILEIVTRHGLDFFLDFIVPFDTHGRPVNYNGVTLQNQPMSAPKEKARIQRDLNYAADHDGQLPDRVWSQKSLRKNAEEVQTVTEQFNIENELLQAENDELKEARDKATEFGSALTTRLNALSDEFDEAQEALTAKSAELDKLVTERDAAEASVARLQAEVEDSQRKLHQVLDKLIFHRRAWRCSAGVTVAIAEVVGIWIVKSSTLSYNLLKMQ